MVQPPIGKACENCARTQTPIWRKSPCGKILCNACGLYLKQQGRMRPLDLDMKPPPKKTVKKKEIVKPLKPVLADENQLPHNGQQLPLLKRKLANEPPSRSRKPSKPIRVNTLPISALPFDYADASEMGARARGPVSLFYQGQRYDIGDYVAVRGVKHPEYFGIITGFETKNEEKYFWMKWLIPKPGHLSVERLQSTPLSLDDFMECEPEVVTCETMEAIKYVFDSVPSEHVTHPNTFYNSPAVTPTQEQDSDPLKTSLPVSIQSTSPTSPPPDYQQQQPEQPVEETVTVEQPPNIRPTFTPPFAPMKTSQNDFQPMTVLPLFSSSSSSKNLPLMPPHFTVNSVNTSVNNSTTTSPVPRLFELLNDADDLDQSLLYDDFSNTVSMHDDLKLRAITEPPQQPQY